ncbi:MAG TPA: TetR family transcriptional regulator, partial [Bryobacteraceae bacterium]|nr:TetR family transcriptional regulator [Bryobacteraceae bacterium]
MSSRNSRDRILDTALDLITKRGEADATMAEIAAASGVSRQAVYLHFADRAALMLALVRHVDEKRGLENELRKIHEAPNAITALGEMVALQARMNPKVWAVARAMDAVRRTDEAAERGWQDRLKHRLEGCQQVVGQLAKEGRLRPEVGPSVAADLLWTITSLRMWEDLVLQRGWSAKRYKR